MSSFITYIQNGHASYHCEVLSPATQAWGQVLSEDSPLTKEMVPFDSFFNTDVKDENSNSTAEKVSSVANYGYIYNTFDVQCKDSKERKVVTIQVIPFAPQT